MAFGILFILAGILIIKYPVLLSFIVAIFLITVGISLISLHLHYKRLAKESDNPFFNFFIRF